MVNYSVPRLSPNLHFLSRSRIRLLNTLKNSECAGIKEEYEKMMVETIRIRVFLCFYCDFEDSDKSDMRRHFKATHHMKLSTGDPLEQGEYSNNMRVKGARIVFYDRVWEDRPMFSPRLIQTHEVGENNTCAQVVGSVLSLLVVERLSQAPSVPKIIE